jgi:hypothetical protein
MEDCNSNNAARAVDSVMTKVPLIGSKSDRVEPLSGTILHDIFGYFPAFFAVITQN